MDKIIELIPETAVELLGPQNNNITMLSHIFPKVKIFVRGNEIKVSGADDDVQAFESRITLMQRHIEEFGKLTETDIVNITAMEDDSFYALNNADANVIVHGREGKVIKAITPKQIKRIILTRPAVEAGENLGFLPGDLRDKLDPYLQPLYDALWDMMPMQKLMAMMEDKVIEIAPLAFMRGRTLDNAYVILDEAQNATSSQLKMFLTRMGKNAKFFITGDITQIDLPKNQQSGLILADRILRGVKGIDFIYMDNKDVVRHHLVTKIITRYEAYENEVEETMRKRREEREAAKHAETSEHGI